MRFTSKEKLVEFLGVARSSRVATAIWHRTCFWISIASSLLELSKSKVKHHARFADRVLKVSDVPAGGENGGRCDIFVVLMGAGVHPSLQRDPATSECRLRGDPEQRTELRLCHCQGEDTQRCRYLGSPLKTS